MKAVQMHQERLTRLTCHKMHTVVLMGNARIRNKWINDPLLHVCVFRAYVTATSIDSNMTRMAGPSRLIDAASSTKCVHRNHESSHPRGSHAGASL